MLSYVKQVRDMNKGKIEEGKLSLSVNPPTICGRDIAQAYTSSLGVETQYFYGQYRYAEKKIAIFGVIFGDFYKFPKLKLIFLKKIRALN